ncbi:MAG: gephyrin-like molybdotransferase Glp [bacterium]
MISVEKAVEIVLGEAKPLPSMAVMIESSKGYILSEPVRADIDFPPFDRVMMDGYALEASRSGEGVILPVDGVIGAGEYREETVPDGHCVKIMTGASLPRGTNAVIRVEMTSVTGDGKVRLGAKIEPGDNVAMCGEEVKKGTVLLPAGTVADSAAVSVMAMAGCRKTNVYKIPSLGILPTGSELVKPSRKIPSRGKIRDSNTYGLIVQCLTWGGLPVRLGNPGDESGDLSRYIEKGLGCDILVISGGVSMGDYDLVPAVLQDLGVEVIFHKVSQKPCKPLLFGKRGNTYVFGLPGNPVAVYLGFELYVGPMIRRLSGEEDFRTRWFRGMATGDFKIKSDRTQFIPCRIEWEDRRWNAYPVESKGSADIFSVVGTNAFARFNKGAYTVRSNEEVDFFFTRGCLYGTQR